MDDAKIPEDMEQVRDRVAVMASRGFPVAEDDVIKEALKLGFQDIVDERMEGNYFTVRWDEDFRALQVYGLASAYEGEAKPEDDKPSYVEQFKMNAMDVWFQLDRAASKIIGR
jgi:hypothetical protein